jgi:hypothetical protein
MGQWSKKQRSKNAFLHSKNFSPDLYCIIRTDFGAAETPYTLTVSEDNMGLFSRDRYNSLNRTDINTLLASGTIFMDKHWSSLKFFKELDPGHNKFQGNIINC